MSDLTGKKYLITGGTGGLGSATVTHLLAQGADCHVTWVFESELEGFSHQDRVQLHKVDCTNEQSVGELYQSLDGLWASIHIVGGFAMSPIAETGAADFESMWRLNALSCFLCCKGAVQAMRRNTRGGRIVNISARPAVQPYGGAIAYAASKTAVASITACLADEVKAEGILVNAVAPSIMDTAPNRAAMPDANFDQWPKVEEVAQAIGFLASPNNRLTSGTVLPVFGQA